MATQNQFRLREYSAYEGCMKLAEFVRLLDGKELVVSVSVTPTVGKALSSSGEMVAISKALEQFAAQLAAPEAQRLVGFAVEFSKDGSNSPPRIALQSEQVGNSVNLSGFERWNLQKIGHVLNALAQTFDILTPFKHHAEQFAPDGHDVKTSLEYATTRLLREAAEQARKNADLIQANALAASASIEYRRQELDAEYERKRERSEKQSEGQMAKLKAEAEAERQSWLAGAQTKEAELHAREAAFNEKAQAFETRDSRWVRRKLLEQIQERINANKIAKLSDETLKKRKIIHWTCQAVMAIGLLSVTLMFVSAHIGGTEWFHIAGSSAGTLLFGSTMVFYLRWTNDWFAQHARIEFRNIKFADDILRASWLAELAFEWETERKTEFPKELMQTFSRDLFLSSSEGVAKHPTDDLARVVRTFRRLRLGRGIVDVESHPPPTEKSETPSRQ